MCQNFSMVAMHWKTQKIQDSTTTQVLQELS